MYAAMQKQRIHSDDSGKARLLRAHTPEVRYMDHPAIFSATLGLYHPWHVVSVSFIEETRMDIRLDFYAGNLFTCPHCGAQKAPCFSEEELWFHDDFFRYETFLHARVPRIECCQGIFATERPWSRSGSRFGRLLEAPAIDATPQVLAGASVAGANGQRHGGRPPGFQY
jgi:hypothetical protein